MTIFEFAKQDPAGDCDAMRSAHSLQPGSPHAVGGPAHGLAERASTGAVSSRREDLRLCKIVGDGSSVECMESLVKTVQGELRGTVADDVYAFFGIPFAAPLSVPNRLRSPRPVQPWSGVRDATRYGPTPPQVAPPTENVGTGWDSGASGKEYLNLNIWTPDPQAAGLPVMVWIQGGQFEFSTTASYDGSSFARDGAVCVVINWRVGAEGFLYLDDGIANLGLLDQIAALEWVRDNIGGFGGDPAA